MYRAAKSPGAKFHVAILLVGRCLLLFTAVSGVLLSRMDVPLLSFKGALVTSLIGAVLGIPRVASPSRANAMQRTVGAALLIVSGAIYLFLFTHPPNSNHVLAGLSGAIVVGEIAAQAGAEMSLARRRERKAKA